MPRHPFHLVDFSPWPFTSSAGALSLAVGLTSWFHGHSVLPLFLGLILISMSMTFWWRDIIRESTFMGYHTSYVTRGLRTGMALFILSEAMFFFGFFWAFFHSSLAPTPQIGCTWPPVGITPINPFSVPLLNTAILLASGVSVTWAHYSLKAQNKPEAVKALTMTVLLGILFTTLQAVEYYEAPFTIADGIYGSTFYVTTGFHGLHVIIGTTFLFVCLIRTILNHFSPGHHFGFEAAAWYWHFVDVVWICLYLSIYWWGS